MTEEELRIRETIRKEKAADDLMLRARSTALHNALEWLDERREIEAATPEEACAIAAKFEAYLTAPGHVFTDGREWWTATRTTGKE